MYTAQGGIALVLIHWINCFELPDQFGSTRYCGLAIQEHHQDRAVLINENGLKCEEEEGEAEGFPSESSITPSVS